MPMLTRVRRTSLAHLAALAVFLLILAPRHARADGEAPRWDMPPRVVDEPAGLARLRAMYAPMPVDQLQAAGFQIDPVCVSGGMVGHPEYGNMGLHAIHPSSYGSQFPNGKMDPDQPPIVLLDGQGRVVGVEWEARNTGQAPPVVYEQMANFGPPHPGVDQPHYMLHAFFLPGGKVQFGDFSQTVSCAARPSNAAAPLPTTGSGSGDGTVRLLVLAATLSLVGLSLRSRRQPGGAA